MKTIRRLVPMLLGLVAVGGAWGATAVGCGSSSGNSTGPSDSGSADATTDAEQSDSAADVVQGDSANDSSAGDTSTSDVFVQADSGTFDAALDANSDGSQDAGSDVNIIAIEQSFVANVAAAICGRVAACCGTSADAAAFNLALCESRLQATGYNESSYQTNLIPAGNVAFNASAAQTCLDTIASLDCTTNQVTTAESATLFQSCFGALSGILPTSAPCNGAIECQPGDYCLPVDGGAGDAGALGVCTPLAGNGGACGVFGNNVTLGNTICSYRGSGSNGFFCQSFEAGVPGTTTNPSTWTCQPQEPNGTGCYGNADCESWECSSLTTPPSCANSAQILSPVECPAFLLDAGGGD